MHFELLLFVAQRVWLLRRSKLEWLSLDLIGWLFTGGLLIGRGRVDPLSDLTIFNLDLPRTPPSISESE